MKKWEYKIIPILTELREERRPLREGVKELLDKHGSEGWELVSTTFFTHQDQIDIIAYLKREKT